jgi:Dolichyl-phosphate-mannose-protein mannosyltransferase
MRLTLVGLEREEAHSPIADYGGANVERIRPLRGPAAAAVGLRWSMPLRVDRTLRLARALLIIAGLLAIWAAAIAITGGFRIELGPVRISSRNAVRVLLLAVVPAALAWRLGYREWLEAALLQWRPVLRPLAAVAVSLMAVGVLIVGALYGVRAAAASDTSGYVSQSALWVRGTLRIDQSYAEPFQWPNAKQTFAPLGYRIGAGEAMVPTYAPGLPLLMAAGRLFSSCGPYLVGPICGALLVFFTFLLGRRLFGTAQGTTAAALVACSPLVVFMALTPMADVPAAAFWTGALALAVPATPRSALAAGLLTGVAILVRPNLVPLAIFPWLLTIVRLRDVRAIAVRTALFAIGSVPAALFIGWVNNLLYGSPLTSGYGDLAPGFSLEYAAKNLRQYAVWWWETQGPLAFLFVIALFRRRAQMGREVAVVLAFGLVLGVLYLFYTPFNAWWFLRFLLPAVPLAFLFCADAIDWAARGSAAVRVAALAAFLVVAVGYAARFADVHDVTAIGLGDQRYVESAAYIAENTPADAVIVTMQHSGSVRYHAGRLTLRWDWMDPEWLDRAIAALQQRGVPTYLLLEEWEDAEFRERFKSQRTLRELDRGPSAVGRNGQLRLYPVKAPDTDGEARRSPVVMPALLDRQCREISADYVEPPAVRTIRRAGGRPE